MLGPISLFLETVFFKSPIFWLLPWHFMLSFTAHWFFSFSVFKGDIDAGHRSIKMDNFLHQWNCLCSWKFIVCWWLCIAVGRTCHALLENICHIYYCDYIEWFGDSCYSCSGFDKAARLMTSVANSIIV